MKSPRSMAILAAVVLTLVFGAVALGQDGLLAGLVQPLVVNIEQQVPVDVTLAVPLEDGSVVTTTAPITVAIALQVKVDGAGVIDVTTGSAALAVIDVEEVMTPVAATTGIGASADAPVGQHQIGEDVVMGSLRWRVLEAVDHQQTIQSSNQFVEDATTAGRFVSVVFEIENLGKERESFLGVDLADAQGRTYGSFDNGYMYVDSNRTCVLKVLQPNIPETCEVIFETPADATELMLKITDGAMFGAETDFVALDL